ncbi:MAG TPA: PQQ-dependent sugar dehydrogenase [Chitinophagaceae bacterium]
MKTTILYTTCIIVSLTGTLGVACQTVTIQNQSFKIDTLYPKTGTTGLNFPWELTYGPDDSLWVTEAHGYLITKVNPRNKGKRTVLDLNSLKDFTSSVTIWPQGGLMGLALHPLLLSGKPYVYVALVYHFNTNAETPGNSACASPGPTGSNNPCYFKTKILRYTYNIANGTLGSPVTVLDNLNGSNDHNSGRLKIGPVESDGKYHLYYTIGDMGAGQFNNFYRTNNAQNTDVYEGKSLRLNTEPDGDVDDGAYNQWIPNDNPFNNSVTGKKMAIYTFGHRNAQGLVWANPAGTWHLYSCEHGDVSDDEVNILEAGRNYGWPKVAGYGDNNYTTHDGAAYTNNDKLAGQNIDWEDTFVTNHNVRLPIFTFFSPGKTVIQNYDWPTPTHWPDIFTWWTVAPSSVDYYGYTTIPGWQNSLIVTSLKYGMFRLQLDPTGMSVTGDTIRYLPNNRIRDVAINPHGDTLYFAIDNSGSTSGPTGGFNGGSVNTINPGYILRMVYLQTLPLIDDSTQSPVNDRAHIRIYPNPATNYVFIECKRNTSKPLHVQIRNMEGMVMLEQTSMQDNMSIPVNSLPRGPYLVQLYNGYGIALRTEKILVL